MQPNFTDLPIDIQKYIMEYPTSYNPLIRSSATLYNRAVSSQQTLQYICQKPVTLLEAKQYVDLYKKKPNELFFFKIPNVTSELTLITARVSHGIGLLGVRVEIRGGPRVTRDLLKFEDFGKAMDYLFANNFVPDIAFEYFVLKHRQPCARVIPNYAIQQTIENFQQRINLIKQFVLTYNLPDSWKSLNTYLDTNLLALGFTNTSTFIRTTLPFELARGRRGPISDNRTNVEIIHQDVNKLIGLLPEILKTIN